MIKEHGELSERYEYLKAEVEDLKAHLYLGKKKTAQLWAGKVLEMIGSGVIGQGTDQPIIDIERNDETFNCQWLITFWWHFL